MSAPVKKTLQFVTIFAALASPGVGLSGLMQIKHTGSYLLAALNQ